MMKSMRTLAAAALLSLVAVPSMRADRMGCIPHPQAVAAPSVLTSTAQAALALLGL